MPALLTGWKPILRLPDFSGIFPYGMKFTDGAWLMREGVTAHYAAELYEVDAHKRGLSCVVPTKPIRHRGDTLSGPLLQLELTSPLPDIIRVKVSHWTGGSPPVQFQTQDQNPTIHTDVSEDEATFATGNLRAKLSRKTWKLEFEGDGKPLTESSWRCMGLMDVAGEGRYLQDSLGLGVGESVYGLGERFTAFVKNGQVVDIWNKDGGTGSDQAYKNIPFYLTNRGYGVFVNDPGPVSFEIGSEKVSRVQFSVPGEVLEYFVIYGPTPKEILAKYTQLTGRPALPPAWTFGLWLTTSFTTSYDEQTVTEWVKGMESHDLPLHVFHFDCFWMREFRWCDFQWDPRVFPDPEGMLARLKERGLHLCVWINPYIGQLSPLFQEGKEKGYLLKKANGDVWQTELWQPGMGIVDFTKPEATNWYQSHLRRLLKQGVDCFKTDFGERIPTDVVYHDGSDPLRMHNLYSQIYNQAVFEVLEEVRGVGEAAVFARSATAGGQQFPIHWGGDCSSTYESMAESLRGGLSLGLSGFGFWSHDIGGFEGMPPADVYKRWLAFGLLSSHSRLHGSSSYRVPWLFDEEAVDVLRTFTHLKCRLMPYLFRQALTARDEGTPLMRAMMLEFPSDPAADGLDRQYMLGERLLVAPVFDPSTVTYYVPDGKWTHLIGGEVIEGPRWVRESHGFLTAPVLVRPNTILPWGSREDVPDYDFADGVEFRVYALDGEARCDVIDVHGAVRLVAVARPGSISVEGSGSWTVRLVGIQVANVSGADSRVVGEDTILTPHVGSSSIAWSG